MIRICLIFNIIFYTNVFAGIPPKQFKSYEFNYSLKSLGLDKNDTHEQIRAKIEKKLDFLVFKNKVFLHKILFLDSINRSLKKQHLILGLRVDLNRPKRSLITLKARSSNPAQLEQFQLDKFEKNKFEIDVNGVKKSYSASHSFTFTLGKDIHPKKLDSPKDILKLIKKKSPYLRTILDSRLSQDLFSKPPITQRKKFIAYFDSRELDIEIWIFGKDVAPLAAVSFKGDATELPALRKTYKKLKVELEKRLILSPKSISKTEAYFNYWSRHE